MAGTPPPQTAPQDPGPSWLALGLWTGIGLALLRTRLLAEFQIHQRQIEPTTAEWHAALGLGSELLAALPFGLVAAGLARLMMGNRPAGYYRTFWALVAITTLCGCHICGFLWAPPARALLRPEFVVDTNAPLAVLACTLLAACLLWLGRGQRVGGITARLTAGLPGIGLGLLACLALAPGYGLWWEAAPPTMIVRRVHRELLADEASWTVIESHPDAAPHVDLLTPAVDYRTDSADLPSLIMSPPCTIEITVGEDEGPVVLRAAAGVDQEAGARRLQSNRWVFGFNVAKRTRGNDGGEEFKPIFSTHIETFRDQPMLERFWRRVGGHEGMVLQSGDTLRLSTWIDGLSAAEAAAQPPLKVGFGELLLEKPLVQPRQPSSPETPNIVLILQDTQRQDRLSCYGYGKPTTPHIDQLAERGLRFDNAYATASWTWPSTASVLTGLQPEAHGVLDDDACYLAHQLETLPEALQTRGYTTAGFTCNPLIVPQKNFDQGFEFFDCNTVGFRKSEHIVPQVTRWIEEHAGTRFFLYLHLVDPHAPHTPRQENLVLLGGHKPESFGGEETGIASYNGRLLRAEGHSETGVSQAELVVPGDHARWMSDVYDASVGTGDWWVGQITRQLEALGLAGETVIAYTSDHGEEWLDHGLLTHGHAVHKELTLIPLILAGPGVRSGAVEAAVTSNRHLATTLAAFGGASLEQVIDPINLATPSVAESGPVMFGTHHGWWNGRQRQPIYGTREGSWVLHFAPHGGDWKVPEEESPVDGQVRLFNLEEDPDEQHDIAAEHPEVVERLRSSILARLEEQASRRSTVHLKAGAATLEMLRGIGYLDDGK
ncbi:MAG: hypothetical protein CMK00_05590 [Planctomycetes bacterium]|nr:hypothetical protein [Planctomycetota bacterium]HJO26602.1 sulfatase [Planctomycetota bacterium]